MDHYRALAAAALAAACLFLSRPATQNTGRAIQTTAGLSFRQDSVRSSRRRSGDRTPSCHRAEWGPYVATLGGRGANGQPPLFSLRDADGDGGSKSRNDSARAGATGIGLRNGYLYVGTPTSVLRYKMTAGTLKPTGAAEAIVGRTVQPAAARGQRHRVRRQRRALCQRRRAVQRVPGAGSPRRNRRDRIRVRFSKVRRHLEVRREQARAEAVGRHAVRDRPAADAGHYLARRRGVHRDEQPRSARHLLAGHRSRRKTTSSGRPSRCTAPSRVRTSAGRTASTTTRRRS